MSTLETTAPKIQKIHILNAENKAIALRRELLAFNDDMRILLKDYAPDMGDGNIHDCIGTLAVNLNSLKRALDSTSGQVKVALQVVKY